MSATCLTESKSSETGGPTEYWELISCNLCTMLDYVFLLNKQNKTKNISIGKGANQKEMKMVFNKICVCNIKDRF